MKTYEVRIYVDGKNKGSVPIHAENSMQATRLAEGQEQPHYPGQKVRASVIKEMK